MNSRCFEPIDERRRPLLTKENEIREVFVEIRDIKNQYEMANSLDVSKEAKAEIKNAFESKIAACRNAIYDIAESIELTTI